MNQEEQFAVYNKFLEECCNKLACALVREGSASKHLFTREELGLLIEIAGRPSGYPDFLNMFFVSKDQYLSINKEAQLLMAVGYDRLRELRKRHELTSFIESWQVEDIELGIRNVKDVSLLN